MTPREPVHYPGSTQLGLTLAGLGLFALGGHAVLAHWAPGVVAVVLDTAEVLLALPQRLFDHGPAPWSRPS